LTVVTKNWEPLVPGLVSFIPLIEARTGGGSSKMGCLRRPASAYKPKTRKLSPSASSTLSFPRILLLTWSRVCHTQQKRLVMHPLKILVLELLPVYALATSSIALREVTALDHERFDDAVEDGALVVQRFARGTGALFAGAKGAEVLGGLGND
jgi:hypothetical protein